MPDPAQTLQYDAPAAVLQYDAPAAAQPAKHDAPPAKHDQLDRLGSNFLSGLGVTTDDQAKNFFVHPLDTVLKSLEAQGELAKKARAAYDRGDYMEALRHGINYMLPFLGQQTDQAGTQLEEGDIAGGAGRTLAVGAGIYAGSKMTPSGSVATEGTGGSEATLGTPATNTASKVATLPIRYAARTVEAALEQKAVPLKPLLRIMTPADEAAAVTLKVPGRDLGLQTPKPAAVDPLNTPVYPGAPLPEHPGVFPGAPLPEHPGVFPGAPLPATPAAEQLNPSLVSESRTLPGQVSAERVFGPRPTPAAPIGARPGLQLPGQVEPQAAAAPTPEATPAAAPEPSAAAAPQAGNENLPVGDNGESILRQILTGQDNKNLMKIAKSRGINVTKEAQLKPSVADKSLVNKIIDDFSDDELDNVRNQYLETTRFRHLFPDIGAEAWKTLSLKTYFPDVKIPETVLRRTEAAVNPTVKTATPAAAKPAPATPAAVATPSLEDQLNEMLTKVKAGKKLSDLVAQ